MGHFQIWFIEKITMIQNITGNKISIPVLLVLVLIFAGYFRINTFWVAHTSGDEFHYVALAMKLQDNGLNGYNIRYVDYENFSLDNKYLVTEVKTSSDSIGILLNDMYKKGRGYYNNPLYNNSPALPYLLMFSQKTLGGNLGYFIGASHLQKSIKKNKPQVIFDAQFYAAIWPVFFSILFVLLTFIAGKIMFDASTGLIAAFLIASDPVSIFTSSKIWADEMSGVFVLLSVIFFISGYFKNRYWMGLLSGIAGGVAILFKQTAGFYIIAIILFHLWHSRHGFLTFKGTFKTVFHPLMILMALGIVLTSGFWFMKVYSVYGEFIHKYIPGPEIKDAFKAIRLQRPPSVFIHTIGLLYISPFFFFSLFTLSGNIRSKFKIREKETFGFLWIWIISYLLILWLFFNGKEHRYFLPAHPAIALLSAFVLNKFRIYLNKWKFGWRVITGNEIIILLLLIYARWAVPIGLEAVYSGAVMILHPF